MFDYGKSTCKQISPKFRFVPIPIQQYFNGWIQWDHWNECLTDYTDWMLPHFLYLRIWNDYTQTALLSITLYACGYAY